jgi:hypothetical protein
VQASQFPKDYFIKDYVFYLQIVANHFFPNLYFELTEGGAVISIGNLQDFFILWGIFPPQLVSHVQSTSKNSPYQLMGKQLSKEIVESYANEFRMFFTFDLEFQDQMDDIERSINLFFERIGLFGIVSRTAHPLELILNFQTFENFAFYANLFYTHLCSDPRIKEAVEKKKENCLV